MAIIIPTSCPSPPPAVSSPLIPYPPSRFQRTASQSTAVRFFVSISPLFCFQQSSLPSPSVCYPVSFGPPSCFLRFACLFLLVRYPVPFVPLLRFFRSATPFPLACSFVSFVSFACSFWPAPLFPLFRFLFPLVWFYEALPRIQLLSLLVLSPPLSGIFVPLKSDPCPSVLETMPFNVRDNAFLAPRTRPSTFKKTPFSSRLRMCLISCQLQVPFRFIPSSQRREFRVCSC